MAIAIVPANQNPDILSGFQMVFDKMAAICLDFKWSGFQISDPMKSGPIANQPGMVNLI